MWDRLRRQVMVERKQLNRLIEMHQPLLEKSASQCPNDIELSALAAVLHSFYTGIENIFRRIALEIDGALPTGEFWHRELLDAVAHSGRDRSAAISEDLRDRLREYLGFRHVFRHAYAFQLQWEKMSHLVLDCEETLRLLEAELDAFLQSGVQNGDN